jgi:alpha-galactosidase
MWVLTTTFTSEDGARSDGVTGGLVHLSAGGVSLVLDAAGDRLPRILHWGAALGSPHAAELEALARADLPPTVTNRLDRPVPVGVVAEASTGWAGTPGISGDRRGRSFSPLFTVTDRRWSSNGAGGTFVATASDTDAQLSLTVTIDMSQDGVVRQQAALRNDGADDYALLALNLTLPVPSLAAELLDFTGRHLRERSPQRHPFTLGSYARDGRRGRTGADATLLLIAGQQGFGFGSGRVWAVHTAWSGNHTTFAERDSAGVSVLGGGELLQPGEVILPTAATYTTPWIVASCGDGLDDMSARLHRYLRARPHHPRSARPVTLNTWEAVYFRHDVGVLTNLADVAADLGVERFVLDDGWFRGRRDDTAGLGDWFVDEAIWPHGLHPLVQHVRDLDMQFGLWFEPEMISPDSDLARQHPDWIMSTGTRTPPESRHQQVLDLSNPAAWDHILDRMDQLISEYSIDYVKWDHNRDLVDAGHPKQGVPGVHDQTDAVYRLIDELKARHPALEIESCSSGGARADLGILERTDRIWASDCIDPLERQQNQRWTGLLLPPELIGSHVGAPTAHTTGRTHDLAFRAGTAFFGHFGIEWDVTTAEPAELEGLRAWIALYKRFRPLLHSGRVVRADHADPAHWVHGVVADDGSEAIYAFVAMRTGVWAPPGRICLPGLEGDALYDVRLLTPPREPIHGMPAYPQWTGSGIRLSGAALVHVGVQAPALHPEHLELLHLTRVSAL